MAHLTNHLDTRTLALRQGSAYRARLCATKADLRSAQALRFEVFNLELDEGLATSYDTGLDADPFDLACDHLIVEDLAHGEVVGTYRLQTGSKAALSLGYYSEREFDLGPFEAARAQILELGRACIHRGHRNFTVLNLLWKGIAAYARKCDARYLIGCSSLTSQDPAQGLAAYRLLQSRLAPPAWRSAPRTGYACLAPAGAVRSPAIPRLMTAYLGLGAAICGPPALDREFGTIDFLTWLDLESATIKALQLRGRFVA